LKQVSGKGLARAIEGRGWTLVRVKGSHHVFIKAGRRERIVIPIHGNQPLKDWPSTRLNEDCQVERRGNIDPDESESGSAA
jgi:predicted RNA binding protein YcfA (HicA-like mRNA interferase family)